MNPTVASLLASLGTVVFVVVALWLVLTRTVLGRGFAVPLRAMFVKPETVSYPEVPAQLQERFHGRHHLNPYEDGLEK